MICVSVNTKAEGKRVTVRHTFPVTRLSASSLEYTKWAKGLWDKRGIESRSSGLNSEEEYIFFNRFHMSVRFFLSPFLPLVLSLLSTHNTCACQTNPPVLSFCLTQYTQSARNALVNFHHIVRKSAGRHYSVSLLVDRKGKKGWAGDIKATTFLPTGLTF